MKRLPALLFAPALLLAQPAFAQITITAADMPVQGDTLRYSFGNPLTTTVSTLQTGANISWDFSAEMPIAQGVDTYKTAVQVNSAYGSTISASAYGFKVADSLPGTPVPVKDVYNFFNKKTSPDRYVIEGFGANIGGFPTPVAYSNEDEMFYFPLQYNDYDSSSFKLTLSLFGLGSLSQEGYRRTRVDAWGTIKTPYTANPVQVIRVRSEVVENDTVKYGTTVIGIPRHYVEYKWLANGEHYPLMFLTADVVNNTETTSSVRYRDTKRSLGVFSGPAAVQLLALYPNPATDAVTLRIPAGWARYTVSLFDAQGKVLQTVENSAVINTSSLPKGQYFLRVAHGAETGLAQFVR
jgi:hypothetical protein